MIRPGVLLLDAGGPAMARLGPEISAAVGGALELPVRIQRAELDLRRAHDPSRGQHNSTVLLAQLLERAEGRPAGEKLLAVVDVDLFIPVLSFVFGEAQLDGRAAVVSTHRLGNPFYGLPRDDSVLTRRLIKEIVHEAGHTLGLIHCRQFECVMRSSTYVEEIDLKRATFCTECGGRVLTKLRTD